MARGCSSWCDAQRHCWNPWKDRPDVPVKPHARRIAAPHLVGAAQRVRALWAGALLSRLVHPPQRRPLWVFAPSFSIVAGAILLPRG